MPAPGRGAVHVDRSGFGGERLGRQPVTPSGGHRRGVAEMRVAEDEGPLRRFDEAVDVSEAVRFGDAEPLENAEDHHRGNALRGRRHVEDRAGFQLERQSLHPMCGKCFQVGKTQGAARRLQPVRQQPREIAAIEIVRPDIDDLRERVGKLGLFENAGFGRWPFNREGRGETGHGFQLIPFFNGERGLRGGHRKTVPRVADGVIEQCR